MLGSELLGLQGWEDKLQTGLQQSASKAVTQLKPAACISIPHQLNPQHQRMGVLPGCRWGDNTCTSSVCMSPSEENKLPRHLRRSACRTCDEEGEGLC